ncbi:hypothetical protein O0Q50_23645 [Priestia aryabhattai]|uniref:Uncharacterized protein n=1 Tax=Priestia aryabhattai TaxID=412384 RepID=A0AAX6NE38_PRIAR|nr:hypothetical protein [Priestia aryabhattai]MDU9694183.1 hypothetical protein [Priestia aryabhattai]
MDNIKHRSFYNKTLKEIEKMIGIKPIDKKSREYKEFDIRKIDRSWGMIDYTVQELNIATAAAHNGEFLKYQTYEVVGYEKLLNGNIAIYYNVTTHRELTETEKHIKALRQMPRKERIKSLNSIYNNLKHRGLTEEEKQTSVFKDISKEERISYLNYIEQFFCLSCGEEDIELFGCECDDADIQLTLMLV